MKIVYRKKEKRHQLLFLRHKRQKVTEEKNGVRKGVTMTKGEKPF